MKPTEYHVATTLSERETILLMGLSKKTTFFINMLFKCSPCEASCQDIEE